MEGMGKRPTGTEKVRRVWKMKNIVFCSGYQAPTLFRNVQGGWHPTNMLTTMGHGQAFPNTTPKLEGSPIYHSGTR